MDAIAMLEADLRNETAASQAVQENADREGRGFSDSERKTLEEHLKNMERIQLRLADEKDKAAFREKVDGFNGALNGQIANPVRQENTPVSKSRNMGEALIMSEGFKLWQAATKESGKPPRFNVPTVFVPTMKTAGDPVLESDNAANFAGGPGPFTTFLGLETPGFGQFPPTVEDLLTTVPVTVGNSVTYPVVKTRTQISATPQTEGAAKPGGEYEFDMVTKVLDTIAGWVKLSTQFIEDAPGLVAYVNADLPLQIRQNVETTITAELYSACEGSGGGGSVSGSGITGSNGYDAILEAMVTIRTSGGSPNGMIIDPLDWAFLLATKNTGGDEGYVGGGPFTPTDNPWGLRVIQTPSATVGLPLVGDFSRGAKVYSRGGYNVDSTNTDQDDFVKNLFTVRAERRMVTGVTYPEFFVEAELGTS